MRRARPATSPPRTCVYLLQGLGIDTGVDLDRLRAAGEFVSAALGRPSASRVARALAARETGTVGK